MAGAETGAQSPQSGNLDCERTEDDRAPLAAGGDMKHGGDSIEMPVPAAAAFAGDYRPSRTNSPCTGSDTADRARKAGDRSAADASGQRVCHNGDTLSSCRGEYQ